MWSTVRPLRNFYRTSDSQEMTLPSTCRLNVKFSGRGRPRRVSRKFGESANGYLACSRYTPRVLFFREISPTITDTPAVFASSPRYDIGTSQPVDMSQLSALIPLSPADYRALKKKNKISLCRERGCVAVYLVHPRHASFSLKFYSISLLVLTRHLRKRVNALFNGFPESVDTIPATINQSDARDANH